MDVAPEGSLEPEVLVAHAIHRDMWYVRMRGEPFQRAGGWGFWLEENPNSGDDETESRTQA
jgi:hypothetical protein